MYEFDFRQAQDSKKCVQFSKPSALAVSAGAVHTWRKAAGHANSIA
jgi:hypothetical protein